MATNTTALARRYRLDVTDDLTLASGWVQPLGMDSFKPTVDANLVDTSSYDSDGWASYEKTFQEWSVVGSFWLRAPSGVFDPAVKILRDKQLLWGDSCRVGVRWYDRLGQPEAYQGVGIVKVERANDGVKDPDKATITIQGDGALASIANPYAAAAIPVVLAATPTAQSVGKTVVISGSGFVGTVPTTGVKFGATNATDWTVLSDSTLVAVMPTGSAGAANIVVTNAAGASTAFSYTRGA